SVRTPLPVPRCAAHAAPAAPPLAARRPARRRAQDRVLAAWRSRPSNRACRDILWLPDIAAPPAHMAGVPDARFASPWPVSRQDQACRGRCREILLLLFFSAKTA